MKQLIRLAGLAVLLAACNSNPYPADASLTPDPNKNKHGTNEKSYALDAPFTVTCNQGIICTFHVTFSVANDTPVLSFENLPAGATVNTATGDFTWTPGRPDTDGEAFVVLVDLRGANDVNIQYQRSVVLIVKAQP